MTGVTNTNTTGFKNSYAPGMYEAPESMKPKVKNSRPFSARESFLSAAKSNAKFFRVAPDPETAQTVKTNQGTNTRTIAQSNEIEDLKQTTINNVKNLRSHYGEIDGTSNINLKKLFKPQYSVKKGIVNVTNNSHSMGDRAMTTRKNGRPITKKTLDQLKEDANFMNINELVRRNKKWKENKQINKIFNIDHE